MTDREVIEYLGLYICMILAGMSAIGYCGLNDERIGYLYNGCGQDECKRKQWNSLIRNLTW